MKTNILSHFDHQPFFSIEGFRQVSGMENPQHVRNLLYRWAKAGYLLQLKKGIYMTHSFFNNHSQDYFFLKMVSAILEPLSYVSLETILQEHNILTEITYPITSITTKNTKRINNSLGTFSYRHIREELYAGFQIEEYYGVQIAQASLAKALFDLLYLRPIPEKYRTLKFNLGEELRLKLDELNPNDIEEFSGYVDASNSPTMKEIEQNFRRYLWQD